MLNGKMLSIIQEKGGVGKSLCTFNLACYFTSLGYKVIILDLDGQRSNVTYYALGNLDKYAQDNADPLTIVDVMRGHCDLDSAIIHAMPGLDILPADIEAASLSQQKDKLSVFKKITRELRDRDYVVLCDLPPSPGMAHYLALSACDACISVILADPSSLNALLSVNESIVEIQETTNESLRHLGVVFNRYAARTNLTREITAQTIALAEQMGTRVFDTKIRQSIQLSEQVLFHKSIFEYAPNSVGAADFKSLGDEIISRMNE